jgi:uncharacterized protein YjbI with pentapeptide repeats
LAGASLAGANLTDANLTDANLTDAYLTDANLTDAYLTGTNLTGAYLTDAYLTDANLTDAYLTDAYLTDANLTDANLTGANLTGVYLTGACLIGAKWSNGIVLQRAPLQLHGLRYRVTILDQHMQIGCELHSLADWSAFDDRRILEMDGEDAATFWEAHRDSLLALAKGDGRSFEPVAVEEAA